MIFNMVCGSGSAALGFKVVGSTSAPSDPTENTIWVNTNTEITSWIFSAAEPESTTEGLVWIQTGTSSPVTFNALKKNGIQVNPLTATQYVNGAWVDKTAKSYRGGAWCDWTPAGALFWHGDQFTSLTGGWSSSNVYSDAAGTFTTDNNMLNISHNRPDAYSSNALKCTNKISLSGAKVLKCNVAAMSGTLETFDFCVKGSGELDGRDTAAKVSISTTGEITLDVSNLSGSYYIYFFSYTTKKTFAYSIDRVWYE